MNHFLCRFIIETWLFMTVIVIVAGDLALAVCARGGAAFHCTSSLTDPVRRNGLRERVPINYQTFFPVFSRYVCH